jgi:flagellar basal body rod protein FlgB
MSQFIGKILGDTATPTLTSAIRFAAKRQALIVENVANAGTPGYRQKDFSQSAFDQALGDQLDRQRAGRPIGPAQPLEPGAAGGILYHDRGNRSMEQLMTESAKNALRHNAMTELLRKQYAQMHMAISGRVA